MKAFKKQDGSSPFLQNRFARSSSFSLVRRAGLIYKICLYTHTYIYIYIPQTLRDLSTHRLEMNPSIGGKDGLPLTLSGPGSQTTFTAPYLTLEQCKVCT